MDNIKSRLLCIIDAHKDSVVDIDLDTLLYGDLKLDSLSLTEIIVACEDEFKIEIDMDHPDTADAKTLRDLYNGIVSLINSN